MIDRWRAVANRRVQLFADCLPVRGARFSAIYDLTRGEIITFPSEFYPLLDLIKGRTVDDALNGENTVFESERIADFLAFLDDNEFVMFTEDDGIQFPPLAEGWDFPGLIQNAVIDVFDVYHDFSKILADLDGLGCQHIQIRSFSDLLSLTACAELLTGAQHTSCQSVELILRYDSLIADEEYVAFVKRHPILSSLALHSSGHNRSLLVDDIPPTMREYYPHREIRFIRSGITSPTQCGRISEGYFTVPTVSTVFEAKSYNGCLNRKIAIDSSGHVRNCPSMGTSFGQVNERPLRDVVNDLQFRSKWGIAKDEIAVCKDCEFRYACSDCRAYIEHPSDPYSKPLKCGYDPYTGLWEEWASQPGKQATAKLYHISVACPDAPPRAE